MASPPSEKIVLKRGAWTAEEDQKLKAYIKKYGIWNWTRMPEFAGLTRSGKSCRLRWMNYLKPGIKRGNITADERHTIADMYEKIGSKWSIIAASLPGRTDNEIKNYWHTHLSKRERKRKPKGTELAEYYGATVNNSKDDNMKTEASLSVGDCSLSTTTSSCGFDETENLHNETIESSAKVEDLLVSHQRENWFMETMNKEPVPEWYIEPTSPCGWYNYECWSDLLPEADMGGLT